MKSLVVFGIWAREKGEEIVGYILVFFFFFGLDMARGGLCLQRNWRGATSRIPNRCNMSKHGSLALLDVVMASGPSWLSSCAFGGPGEGSTPVADDAWDVVKVSTMAAAGLVPPRWVKHDNQGTAKPSM